MTPAHAESLTAEEFARLPGDGVPTELVRGKVVRMTPPYPYHGYVCSKTDRMIGGFVDANDLGRCLSNDAGIITQRGPDSVRGADIAFYSYNRLPRGPLPLDRYLDVVPELIFEIRSPSDRWSKVLEKVTEYLKAGITVVCVIDPKSLSVHIHRDDEMPRMLQGDDEVSFPDILPGFRVPAKRFFE